MISVDRLGHLRDVYGYDSKEAILAEVARLLRAETRTCDFLGRLMDDRLLAVVPHTDSNGARILAERLLAGVRQLHFASEGQGLKVTASIGGSCLKDGSTMFFDTLLGAAEGALAAAAEAGGDRYAERDPGPRRARSPLKKSPTRLRALRRSFVAQATPSAGDRGARKAASAVAPSRCSSRLPALRLAAAPSSTAS